MAFYGKGRPMSQYITSILMSVGIADIIDIIIISFFVYTFLKYIRSTRAEQLAKGLLIVVVANFLSGPGVFHLYTVHWILSKVLDIGLIALIVVFQPELRRALEYLGRGKFRARQYSMTRERISENIMSIVRATEYFADRKEGAIMVFERETALQDIVETGTVIDAQISEEALENIFYKGAPLHDGAVIIRNDRIYAAGCVLPLTENQNLSKDLGTRHRAGIGITEVSDAIVLIISEETGIISMASGGKLSRFLDPRTVEKNLLAVYMNSMEGGSAMSRLSDIWKSDIWRRDRNESKEND